MAEAMKCLLILCAALAVSASDGPYSKSDAFIEEINAQNPGWVAGRNFREGENLDYLAGELMNTDIELSIYDPSSSEDQDNELVPESFDAREQWPHCPSILSIKHQSNCNAWWAISVASVVSDRFCVASNGAHKEELSSENLLSCCSKCSLHPCLTKGGCPINAWEYAQTTGLVTGGDYGSKQGCQPYKLRPCGAEPGTCTKKPKMPKCIKSCYNHRYRKPYDSDLHRLQTVYRVSNSTKAIQRELRSGGPVTAHMILHEDLLHYKSGVYKHTSGEKLGCHNVRLLGWGTSADSEQDYWLIANSWGKHWGDAGTFKIARGVMECGIEEMILSGIPQL